MKYTTICVAAFGIGTLLALPSGAATIYNNLTPNANMAMATRTDANGQSEIETADDFLTANPTLVTSASFTGLIVPGRSQSFSIADVSVEIYRVFTKTPTPSGPPAFRRGGTLLLTSP